MQRLLRPLTLVAIVALATAGTALAGPPDKGCPNATSGFQSITLNFTWEVGDPIPGPGEDAWWDLTVAGFTAEGLTLQAAATAFGFATPEELYEFVALGIRTADKNGDHAICWKPYPEHQNGSPAYILNVVDTNAR